MSLVWQCLSRGNLSPSFCYAEYCSEDVLVRKIWKFFLYIKIEPNNGEHPGGSSALPGFARGLGQDAALCASL